MARTEPQKQPPSQQFLMPQAMSQGMSQGPLHQQQQQQQQQGPLAPRKRRRTLGDIVTGLAAFIALAVLVVGVPLALAYFVGWPLPHHRPTGNFLNASVTTKTFTNTLAVLVWLAWAQFTACVLVEVAAAARGIGMPGHVPLSGGSQLLARQLVAAVLLITASAASFAPGLSSLGPTRDHGSQRAPIAATSTVRGNFTSAHVSQPTAQRGTASTTTNTVAQSNVGAPKAGVTKFYRVAPPQGRHHDSLWDIADRHLGDGRRYQEIYDLNKDRVQPDGSTLTKASLIRPGWILEMPGDAFDGDLAQSPFSAHGAAVPGADAPGADAPGQSGSSHAPAGGSTHGTPAPGVDASFATSPAFAAPVAATRVVVPASASGLPHIMIGDERRGAGLPGGDGTATPAPAPHNPAAAHTPQASAHAQAPDSHQTPFRLPYELAASPLLAAGLLGALGRNRRRQLWNRAVGRRLAAPGTDAAAAEEALRLGAGLGEVRFLNQALRELAVALVAAGRPLPAVYSARLTDDGLELLLSAPAPDAPAPWSAREDARAWFVPRGAVGHLGADAIAAAVAPYPGLVSVGISGTTRILLDLEAASGVIAVAGDDPTRRAVLAAMAVELATNTWSDRMTVTLVGFAGDLAPLAPGRIRQAARLEDVLPDLRTEIEERRRALGQTGLDSVLSGRLGGVGGAGWPPHFVISAAPGSAETASALAEMAGAAGRIGVGYLIAGDVPAASWRLTVDAGGRLTSPMLDLDIDAQRLPDGQYTAILALFAATTDLLGVAIEPLTAEAAVLEAQLRVTPTVSVRLLGELEVTGAGEIEAERRPLVAEALTFLMIHRDGADPRVLTSALWPRGVTSQISDAVLGRLGAWLGSSPDGSPNLMALPDGRLTLGPSVRSDWEMFRTMRALADQDPRYQDPNSRDQLLGQALGLVREPLLARREPGRYGWLAYESLEAEIPAIIADTAVEVCDLRLAVGNAKGAVDAVRSGLRGSPADEELWRALLRATHATGDARRLFEVVEALQKQTRAIHGERGLHPKTEALVDELLPSWRTPATIGA